MKNRSLLAVLLILLGCSASAQAQFQQVRIDVRKKTANDYQASIYYQPSDGRRTTGLGLRLHYPASVIQVSGTTQVLSGVMGLQIQADTADHDHQALTDTFINAAWFDLNGHWPSAMNGETLLFQFDFSLVAPTQARHVVFNVTPVSTATGYSLQATPYQAMLGGEAQPSEPLDPGSYPGNGNAGAGVPQIMARAHDLIANAQSPTALRTALQAAFDDVRDNHFLDTLALESLKQLTDETIRRRIRLMTPAVTTDADIRQMLMQDPQALQIAIDMAPRITGTWRHDAATLGTVMAEQGLDAALGERLAETLAVIQSVDGLRTGEIRLAERLREALGAGSGITTDPITGTVVLDLISESYRAAILTIRLVGDLLPQGLQFAGDGRAVLVYDGFAFEMVPLAADLTGFMAAVERAAFQFSLQPNGVIELILTTGDRFVGAFAYDAIGVTVGACGGLHFHEPQGAVTAAEHAFVVSCTNGIQQRVQPFVHDPAFLALLGSADGAATADRNTGFINLPGTGLFKPGFFVSPLSAGDQDYLERNRNPDGLALRQVDVDADGAQDYLLYSPKGVQALWALRRQ